MKASVFVNTPDSYISDEQIIEVMEGLDDPFYGKFVKEDLEVSVSLWTIEVHPTSSYGHWKVCVGLQLNGNDLFLTKITTDSMAVDAMKRSDDFSEHGEKEGGYLSLFKECMNANESEVYELLDTNG